jgi:hypothetical protein
VHGCSIGCLGKDNSLACVSDVVAESINVQNALYGVRIKTWQVRRPAYIYKLSHLIYGFTSILLYNTMNSRLVLAGRRGFGEEHHLLQRQGGERGHADRHRPVLLRPGRGAVSEPDRCRRDHRRNVPGSRGDVLVPAGAAGVQRRQAVHGRQHGGRAPDAGAGERVPRSREGGVVLELLRRGAGDHRAFRRWLLAEHQRICDALTQPSNYTC